MQKSVKSIFPLRSFHFSFLAQTAVYGALKKIGLMGMGWDGVVSDSGQDDVY